MEYFHRQLGLAAWLRALPAPAHQLKLGKILELLATKDISVINILLVLNPKHSS